MTYSTLLRKVMKAAHTIRVRDGKTMSQALKAAWAWAKKKLWNDYVGGRPVRFTFSELVTSTNKAIKVAVECIYSDHGTVAGQREIWLPKSQINVTGNIVELPVWLLCEKQNSVERSFCTHRTENVDIVFPQV